MPRYGSGAQKAVKSAMHRKKSGTLRSGRSHKKVTSRKQAIAIGLSEAREKGAKVPSRSSRSRSHSSRSSPSHSGSHSSGSGRRSTSRKHK